ncbi:MAG: MFS transporter [Ilumatobacteraceae bacterium]
MRLVDETTGFLAPASVERFRADLGIGYGIAAAMFVAYGLGGLLGVAAVAWSDGKSRKTVTWSGAMVLALSLATIGAARSAPWLLAGTFLEATGATMLVHGGEITIANALAAAGLGHQLERALARTNVLAVAGDVAGPLVVAATRAAGLGWRPLFFAIAALVALYGVILSRLAFPEPVAAAVGGGVPVPIRRQPTVWLIALAAAASMPLDEAYLATVLAFAEVREGFSSSGAALLGATFVAGGLVSLTALTGVIARTAVPTLLTVSAFGLSAVMIVATIGPGWVLVPVGLVHSALLAATWLTLQTVVLRANPGREGATKVVVEVLETSSFAIVLAIGVLADRAGLRWAMAAFAVVPLLLLPVATGYRRRQ